MIKRIVGFIIVAVIVQTVVVGCRKKTAAESENESHREITIGAMKQLQTKWELIDVTTYAITYRMKVHGGWIVRVANDFGAHAGDIVFVSDAQHVWIIRNIGL